MNGLAGGEMAVGGDAPVTAVLSAPSGPAVRDVEGPRRRRWLWALAGVALLQLGVLGWMLLDRVLLLRSPTEITVRPEPVDPRDLFRGDFVILDYRFSRMADAVRETLEPEPEAGEALWASLAPTTLADGTERWDLVALSRERPASPPEGGVLTRPQVDEGGRRLLYGVERYYVPEGRGLELEREIGEDAVAVRLAIGGDGRVAVKGFSVRGETVFEEPWF